MPAHTVLLNSILIVGKGCKKRLAGRLKEIAG